MSGSTNFEFWSGNSPFANAESDATYTSDATRQGGAVSGPFAPQLANKFFGQESILTNAIVQFLVSNGYSPNDGSANPSTALANLTAVLASAFILANSAVFSVSPTAPTPSPGDNSTKLATTAFIQAIIAATPRVQSGRSVGGPDPVTITFPVAFSGTPNVVVTTETGTGNIVPGSVNSTSFQCNHGGLTIQWIAVGPR
jgi:hypothetical protein